MEERTESSTLDDAYFDRNQAVMLAARFALELGYVAGWKPNKDDPGWPILVIDLPTGQVSWHIPFGEAAPVALGTLAHGYDGEWDGHTVEEKRRRIDSFLQIERGEK